VNCRWLDWSGALAEMLAPAARRDPLGGLEMLAQDVLDGSSRAFGVFDDAGQMVLATVLRLESFPHGRELLIQAASGSLPGVSLVDTVYPAIERVAVAAGCGSVRLQSSRPGMARAMARHGFAECDHVYRKWLHVGRKI